MKVWKKLPDRLMAILSDDVTDELSAAVQRISGSPLAERQARSKDLGETMVIAHAAVAAESGVDVIVLIDEGPGTRQAAQEARRLDRMRGGRGQAVGSIRLATTKTVLERGVQKRLIADRGELRRIYDALRALDDGLPPISHTGLLSGELWNSR